MWKGRKIRLSDEECVGEKKARTSLCYFQMGEVCPHPSEVSSAKLTGIYNNVTTARSSLIDRIPDIADISDMSFVVLGICLCFCFSSFL